MGFCDPARDRQPKARAATVVFPAGTRFVCAEEAFEDSRLEIEGDASAGIRDAQGIFSAGTPALQGYAAACRRVFDGIVEEVEDHAAQERFVANGG